MAQRYEFYVLVARTISHSNIKFISSRHRLISSIYQYVFVTLYGWPLSTLGYMSCINFLKTSLASSDPKFAPWLGNSRIKTFPKAPDECRWGKGGGRGGGLGVVWNRVYMIAPVNKIGRVRLSTKFLSKQIWRRMHTWKDDEFLLGFKFSRVQKHQENVFMNFFNGSFGHQETWHMNSSWVTLLHVYTVIRRLGKFSFDTPVISRTWISERLSS